MKVTIELSPAQIKGLKDYLKSVSNEINPKNTVKEIKEEVRGMVSAELQAGAVGDYIRQAEVTINL